VTLLESDLDKNKDNVSDIQNPSQLVLWKQVRKTHTFGQRVVNNTLTVNHTK